MAWKPGIVSDDTDLKHYCSSPGRYFQRIHHQYRHPSSEQCSSASILRARSTKADSRLLEANFPSVAYAALIPQGSRKAYRPRLDVVEDEDRSELVGRQVVLFVLQRSKSVAEGPQEHDGALVGSKQSLDVTTILDKVRQNVSVDHVLELLRKFLQRAGLRAARVHAAAGLS